MLRSRISHGLVFVCSLGTAACADSPVEPAAPPALAVGSGASYEMIDLGTMGGSFPSPLAINDEGTVIGNNPWDGHGWVWKDGTLFDLGGTYSQAVGINASGTVALNFNDGTRPHAATWRNGVMTILPGLPVPSPYPVDAVTAINNRGTVIGYSNGKPVIWENGAVRSISVDGSESGTLHFLNDAGEAVINVYLNGRSRWYLLRGDRQVEITWPSDAFGIQVQALNARGQVAGIAITSSGVHGFLWDNGNVTDLGDLGLTWYTSVWPRAMNDRGEITGDATHAFRWWNGQITDLGTLGGSGSWVRAINATGTIVGYSNPSTSWEQRAVAWKNGAITDLGTLAGGTSSQAVAINARGEILGGATTSNYAYHVVIWRPRNWSP